MTLIDTIAYFFEDIINSIPVEYRLIASLFFYTIFISLYAIFIWKFYKFLSRRDIIQLNLAQYNSSTHPLLEKFFAVILYSLEYLIILPFLVLFWFTIFSLFLLLLSSETQTIQQILLVSAAIIASTRISSYISEDLSKDLAKILPFTILAAYLLNPDFFNLNNILGKILGIPALFNQILSFLAFIFLIEFLLRSLYSIVDLVYFSKSEELEKAAQAEIE